MKKTTQYKGVCWRQKERKWCAQITYQKQRIECGRFDDEISAIKARDRKIMALGLPNSLLQIFKPLNNEKV